jgi:hypothetical protein
MIDIVFTGNHHEHQCAIKCAVLLCFTRHTHINVSNTVLAAVFCAVAPYAPVTAACLSVVNVPLYTRNTVTVSYKQ